MGHIQMNVSGPVMYMLALESQFRFTSINLHNVFDAISFFQVSFSFSQLLWGKRRTST